MTRADKTPPRTTRPRTTRPRTTRPRPPALALPLALLLAAGSLAATPAGAAPRNGKESHFNVELGGQALIWSLNYERRIQGVWTLRIGVGAWPDGDDTDGGDGSDKYFAVPLAVGALIGGRAHMLDVSAGATWLKGSDWLPAANIGYRHITPGGLVFRAFATPAWELAKKKAFVWGGLSAGITF